MARRGRRFNGGGGGTSALRALGGIVALVLALYMFDLVIDGIAPTLYSCGPGLTYTCDTAGCGTLQRANVTFASATCNQLAANGSYPAEYPSYFSTSFAFIANLLPVLGILGAFELIFRALKSSKLM